MLTSLLQLVMGHDPDFSPLEQLWRDVTDIGSPSKPEAFTPAGPEARMVNLLNWKAYGTKNKPAIAAVEKRS